MITLSGKEFKEFMDDDEYWTKDTFLEDDTIIVDNFEVSETFFYNNISDTSIVKATGSIIFKDKVVKLETFIKNWRKKQNTTYIILELDKDNLEDILKSLKSLNCKIIK